MACQTSESIAANDDFSNKNLSLCEQRPKNWCVLFVCMFPVYTLYRGVSFPPNRGHLPSIGYFVCYTFLVGLPHVHGPIWWACGSGELKRSAAARPRRTYKLNLQRQPNTLFNKINQHTIAVCSLPCTQKWSLGVRNNTADFENTGLSSQNTKHEQAAQSHLRTTSVHRDETTQSWSRWIGEFPITLPYCM